MQINQANLGILFTGLKASFQKGLGQADSDWERIATKVPSSTREELYGWLGKLPSVREWLGPRVVHGIGTHDYRIVNKPFELTIGVDRDDIEDDLTGQYASRFEEMGRSVAAFPAEQVFPYLNAGFTTPCYDGQNFFDTDHPVLDADGNEISVANTDGGAGTPWFLIDASRSLKPIIYQERRPFEFVARDKKDDDNVFNNKEFQYGVDGRSNVGFGFWQFAWGSKQPLNATNFRAARTALSSMKGDYGRPLGLRPNLLVVPPALEEAAQEVLEKDRLANGETNINKGLAEIMLSPWLA